MQFKVFILLTVAVRLSNQTKTVFEFSRKMDTCDKNRDRAIQGTTKVIYAHNPSDPEDNDPSKVLQHQPSSKGTKKISFRTSGFETELEKDTKTLKIGAVNYEVPCCERKMTENSTIWMSMGFDLWEHFPEADATHSVHLTKWEVDIQKENFHNFHHMLLTECPEGLDAESLNPANFGESYADVPDKLAKCWLGTSPLITWSLGGEPQAFPKEAGLRVGGPGGLRYVLIENHYDMPWYNPPEGAPDSWKPDHLMVDSSGVIFYYTTTLRQHDLGVTWLGVNPDRETFLMPAGQPGFVNTGINNPECTRDVFPKSGEVHVSQVLMHMHNQGTRFTTRHVRDGVELEPISYDWNYDNYYQQYVDVDFTWEKDDYIIAECEANTEEYRTTARGGFATDEQMCILFLVYYPAFDSFHKPLWSVDERHEVPGQFRSTCNNETFQYPVFESYEWPDECTEQDITHPIVGSSDPDTLAEFDRSKYSNHIYLDPEEIFELHFQMNPNSDVVDMAVEVETEGWVGIGISQTGGMKHSDIAIAWVDDKTGQPYFHDRWATDNAVPEVDYLQDCFNIKGAQGGVYPTYLNKHGLPELGQDETSSGSFSLAVIVGIALVTFLVGIILGGAGVYVSQQRALKYRAVPETQTDVALEEVELGR